MSIWDQHLVPAVPRILAQSANYSTGCAAWCVKIIIISFFFFLWEGVRLCTLCTDHALIQKHGTHIFVILVQWKYKRRV